MVLATLQRSIQFANELCNMVQQGYVKSTVITLPYVHIAFAMKLEKLLINHSLCQQTYVSQALYQTLKTTKMKSGKLSG